MEEFTIKAVGHPSEPDRQWTRNNLAASKSIANQAVEKLGYAEASVYDNRFKAVIYVYDERFKAVIYRIPENI